MRILVLAGLLLWGGTLTAQAEPSRCIALVAGTVYDGTDAAPLRDATVLVRDGRIEAIGSNDAVAVPDDARVVDCSGRFLTPGFVDAHVHYSQTGWADGRPDAADVRAEYPYAKVIADNAAHPERFHLAFLASGVTAVFDVGGYPWTRHLARRTENSPWAPHVAASGALLTTWKPEILGLPDQQQFVLMEDEQVTRAAVRSHAAAGSAAIKIWFIVFPGDSVEAKAPLVHAAGDEARKLGLPLIVHATSLATAKVAVAAGARLLVHSVEDEPVDDEFVAAAKRVGTFYCPTLIVRDGYTQLYTARPSAAVLEQLPLVHPSVRARVLATKDLPPRLSPRVAEGMAKRRELERTLMADNLMRLFEAGVPVVMGTDAGNPLTLHGPSIVQEMLAMQAAGLTPQQVLIASTRDAARAMGRDDLGVLAVGRIADLVVLAKDPGTDIANVASVVQVCRAGVLHERAALLQQ